jgi:hypothetical protein
LELLLDKVKFDQLTFKYNLFEKLTKPYKTNLFNEAIIEVKFGVLTTHQTIHLGSRIFL